MNAKQFSLIAWLVVILLAAVITGAITGWIYLRWYEITLGIYFVLIIIVPWMLYRKE